MVPVGRLGLSLPSGRRVTAPIDAQAELRAQRVGDGLVVDDHLDHAAGVAEVDERHATVVAALGHPAAERDLGPMSSARSSPQWWVRRPAAVSS